MTTQKNRSAAELRAELVVEDSYHYGRSAGYLDLAGSRRDRALNRLEDEAKAQAKAEGYATLEAVDLTRADVADAFRRMARRRLARDQGYRDHRAPAVRNALRRAAVALTLGTYVDGVVGTALAEVLEEVGVTGPLERIPRRGLPRGTGRAGALTVEA